jgi:uncharacterized integral membrane protein
MNAIVKVLIYLAVVIVLVALAYWNVEQSVDVTFYPGRVLEGVPVFLVILSSIFLGVLIAGVIGAVEQIRHRLRERDLTRQIEELEAELRELRNLPISEGLLEQDEGPAAWVPTE